MYPMHLRCKHLCSLPLNTEGTYMVCSNWLLTLRNVILLDINLKPSPYPSSHLWAISFCLWNENKVQKSHLLIFMKEHMLHFEEVQKIFYADGWIERRSSYSSHYSVMRFSDGKHQSLHLMLIKAHYPTFLGRELSVLGRYKYLLHSSGGPTVTQKAQAFYRSRKESRK